MIGTHHNSQIIEVECIIAQIMVEVRDVFNDARHPTSTDDDEDFER